MTTFHQLNLILAAKGLLLASARLTMVTLDLASVADLGVDVNSAANHRLRTTFKEIERVISQSDT